MPTTLNRKKDGVAIALSWPDTLCKQASAWYEPLTKLLRINKNGYYKVGHAAIVLIHKETLSCQYFDFGRYHAPSGSGRVRDAVSDHDLKIETIPLFDEAGELLNLNDILQELYENPACHGSGYLYASAENINWQSAHARVEKFQSKDFWPYGPLVWNGTNCSRFVASVLLSAGLNLPKRIRMFCQPTVSPSPKGNIKALSSTRYAVGKKATEQVTVEVSHLMTTAE